MIRRYLKATALSLSLLTLDSNALLSQTVGQGAETSEAILSTSVLFAIGAREAQQQIRGSFGWPTFQEGFVDGVYFRFDPDGYARFSSSPRLDEDVFEVVCATGSVICAARKGPMEIGLTAEGRIQIRVTGIAPDDSYFVSDKKTELPLPPSIIEPLDARLETLLSSGGELIVRRSQETIQTVSLSGFSAVSTYLRWVAQGQSSRVFPRGWPTPAQGNSQSELGLTQPNQWVPPNSGPQQVATTFQTLNNPQIRGNYPQASANQLQASGFGNNVQGSGIGNSVTPSNSLSVKNDQSRNLQLMMASLQNQLTALQQAASTSGLQNGQAEFNGGQAEQNTDFGASFAEQARARNLPVSNGLSATQEIQSSELLNGALNGAPTGRTTLGQTSNHASNHLSPNAPDTLTHLNRLEGQILQLRQEMTMLFSQLNQTLLNTVSGAGHFDAAATQNLASQQSSNTRDGSSPSREGWRATMPEAPLQDGVQRNVLLNEGKVSLERDLVESLLRNLETDLNSNGDTSTTDAVEVAPPIEAKEPAVSGDGDFISLSDYINKVLKSESGAQ